MKFDPCGKRLDIYTGRTSELLPCPVCGKPCVDYDSMERVWRYVDFFQYEAYMQGYQIAEGINNKIRTAFRDSYGFKSKE